jgi:hypothetical protein
MRARKHGLAAGLLVVLATSVPALAQTSPSSTAKGGDYPVCSKKPEPAESDSAHNRYIAGKVDYDDGHYDDAIRKFRAAYELDCTKHELLVIISRSYEFKNDFAEAIRALETYLERQPSSPDAPSHRNRIATLKERQAAQKAAPNASASPSSSSSATSGNTGQRPPGAESSGHTVYPWIVVGAGVVAAAVGIVLVAAAPALPVGCDEKTKECTLVNGETKDSASYRDRRDEAGRSVNQPIIGAVVAAGGGALVIGGLVWYFLEPSGSKDSAKTKVQPQLGPGYGGFALTGRF